MIAVVVFRNKIDKEEKKSQENLKPYMTTLTSITVDLIKI